MEAKLRENKILEILQTNQPVQSGIRLPIRPDRKFNVYKIPLELLIYNYLNDRFASSRVEFETVNPGHTLSDDEESQEIIAGFIWDSNQERNKLTLKDILKNKQQRYGVITKDGRVIDGNRRLRILREIYHSADGTFPYINKSNFKFFEAIILPEDIDDKEIQLLETQLQMGEDEKLEYGAIEKYLKVNKLKEDLGLSYKEISSQIQQINNEKDAIKIHETYKLMEEYLITVDAPNKFSLIKKSEDLFLQLRNILSNYKNGTYLVDWNPNDTNITELKMVCFDYIRINYEGKDFRNLMGGPKDRRGVFSKKDIWDKFLNKHQSKINDAEREIRNKIATKEIKDIQQRESYFKERTLGLLEQNLANAKEAIRNRFKSRESTRLFEEALGKIDSVDVEYLVNNFDKNAYNILKEIIHQSNEIKERLQKDVFDKEK